MANKYKDFSKLGGGQETGGNGAKPNKWQKTVDPATFFDNGPKVNTWAFKCDLVQTGLNDDKPLAVVNAAAGRILRHVTLTEFQGLDEEGKYHYLEVAPADRAEAILAPGEQLMVINAPEVRSTQRQQIGPCCLRCADNILCKARAAVVGSFDGVLLSRPGIENGNGHQPVNSK